MQEQADTLQDRYLKDLITTEQYRSGIASLNRQASRASVPFRGEAVLSKTEPEEEMPDPSSEDVEISSEELTPDEEKPEEEKPEEVPLPPPPPATPLDF